MAGRKSKLTPFQVKVIKEKSLSGVSMGALAKEFKVGKTTIARAISEQVNEMKSVAISIASQLEKFDNTERSIINHRVNDLLTISASLGQAAINGSETAERISAIAKRHSLQVEDCVTIDGKTISKINTEELKSVMALSQTATEASKIPLNLLAANKKAIDDMNDRTPEDEIPTDLGFLYQE